ncbi:MAG: tRNA (adenosine(37)-N6)-threonylcarbamoyltransferase complex ATPase subunit type 1 TsaE [Candidatus Saccharibacteria bacterium]
MNTDQKSLRLTTDLSQSLALANNLASIVQPPQLIELVGDLGGGKTTFTKAFGKALGVEKTITSPTFNIHRSYEYGKTNRLEHFDLYRLNDDEIVLNELQEKLNDPKTITVVEWAGNFSHTLAKDRLVVEFHFINEEKREIVMTATGVKSQAILEKLK